MGSRLEGAPQNDSYRRADDCHVDHVAHTVQNIVDDVGAVKQANCEAGKNRQNETEMNYNRFPLRQFAFLFKE